MALDIIRQSILPTHTPNAVIAPPFSFVPASITPYWLDLIKAVTSAIQSEFDSDSDLSTALPGGLWFTEAKQNTVLPYGVYFWFESLVQEYLGDENQRREVPQLQFNLYSKDGSLDISDIADKTMALYDWNTITLDTDSTQYSTALFERVTALNVGFVYDVWQYTIIYELFLS